MESKSTSMELWKPSWRKKTRFQWTRPAFLAPPGAPTSLKRRSAKKHAERYHNQPDWSSWSSSAGLKQSIIFQKSFFRAGEHRPQKNVQCYFFGISWTLPKITQQAPKITQHPRPEVCAWALFSCTFWPLLFTHPKLHNIPPKSHNTTLSKKKKLHNKPRKLHSTRGLRCTFSLIPVFEYTVL